jgi:hypothetical protein
MLWLLSRGELVAMESYRSEEDRALEALRNEPAEFLRSTHRNLPFGFSRPASAADRDSQNSA